MPWLYASFVQPLAARKLRTEQLPYLSVTSALFTKRRPDALFDDAGNAGVVLLLLSAWGAYRFLCSQLSHPCPCRNTAACILQPLSTEPNTENMKVHRSVTDSMSFDVAMTAGRCTGEHEMKLGSWG